MDIIALYNDYSIPYLTEGHYHCVDGWVQTHCPHCIGEQNYHLGYNLADGFYSCWRCGGSFVDQTIAKLLNVPLREAKKIIKQYDTLVPSKREPIVKVRNKAHKLPSNTMPLQANHKKYLERRGFDPDYLEKLWGLVGTGPVSRLDTIDYKHRIIIPFIWDGQQVSFDSRDITSKHKSKYMACPKDRELIHHKNILYGKQEAWKETGIVVEGPSDVWRFGNRSLAVSGIKYTSKQIREMANIFTRIAVVFDDDPQAIVQANKIVAELKFRGVDAFRVDIKEDPGSMKQEDADYLVKQLL